MRVSHSLPQVQAQVDRIEAAGYRVRLRHTPTAESGVHPAVGLTEVSINDPANPNFELGYGRAWCSKKDAYSKVDGTKIAFRRAISDFYQQVGHVVAKKVLYPRAQ